MLDALVGPDRTVEGDADLRVLRRHLEDLRGTAGAGGAWPLPGGGRGSHCFFCSAEPASRMARPPRSVARNGPGMTTRPISSMSTVRSTKPRPTPPYSSG